jgi:hypothetical protein
MRASDYKQIGENVKLLNQIPIVTCGKDWFQPVSARNDRYVSFHRGGERGSLTRVLLVFRSLFSPARWDCQRERYAAAAARRSPSVKPGTIGFQPQFLSHGFSPRFADRPSPGLRFCRQRQTVGTERAFKIGE